MSCKNTATSGGSRLSARSREGRDGRRRLGYNFYRTMKKKAHGLFWTEKACDVPAVSVPKTS